MSSNETSPTPDETRQVSKRVTEQLEVSPVIREQRHMKKYYHSQLTTPSETVEQSPQLKRNAQITLQWRRSGNSNKQVNMPLTIATITHHR